MKEKLTCGFKISFNNVHFLFSNRASLWNNATESYCPYLGGISDKY